MGKLLEVNNLKVYFYTDNVIPAVDGVTFDIYSGETLCVVGESGCGKSVTAMSIMQLVATPPGKYIDGEIIYDGTNLLTCTPNEMTKIRGKEIAMIFQEPMTALNPIHTAGDQIAEALSIHNPDLSKKELNAGAVDMLRLVGVPDPERCARSYPHQLSGGMCQRVLIAMAFSCSPRLLIADEPTTALDVTVQAQILALITRLKEQTGMTVMFITHDLGVVADIADRVIVMYSGKIVEEASCGDLFRQPLHPYTAALLKCIPRIDVLKDELDVIQGQVPNPANFPSGCRFHPRCDYCMEICKTEIPELRTYGNRRVACHLIKEDYSQLSGGQDDQ